MVCKGYIDGLRYVHGPVRFRYNALWPEGRTAYFKKLESLPSAKAKEIYQAGFVAKRLIVDWNQTYCSASDQAGEPLPITAEAFSALDDMVQGRMVRIMFRQSESDLDPEDPVEDQLKTMMDSDRTAEEALAELDAEDAESVGNSSGA